MYIILIFRHFQWADGVVIAMLCCVVRNIEVVGLNHELSFL